MNPLLATALLYARKRISVLPLPPFDKEARARGHYCSCTGGEPLIGSTNEDVLRRWWAEEPKANVGVVTGARSRLLVVDVDERHSGSLSLQTWLALQDHVFPPHPVVDTPSGGQHHWFRLPPEAGTERRGHLKTKTSWLQGVDVKACGGYVAAPPSVRSMQVADDAWEGRAYVFRATEPVGLPDAPEWLLQAAVERQWRPVGPSGRPIAEGVLPPTEEFIEHGLGWYSGSRNSDAFRLACRLWSQFHDDEAQVMKVLGECWTRTATQPNSTQLEVGSSNLISTQPNSGGDEFSRAELEYAAHSARVRMRRAREEEQTEIEKILSMWDGSWKEVT